MRTHQRKDGYQDGLALEAAMSGDHGANAQEYVGYIVHEHIIGISKLTRLVKIFARQFAVQERIGRQIADTLYAMMQPRGVAVYLETHHLCVEMRGVREISLTTRTTVWRGEYEENPALREESFVACGLRR